MSRPADDGEGGWVGWDDLDLLPDYFLDEASDPRGRQPIPEAFRLLAPPASAWDRVQPQPRLRDQLWLDPASWPRRPWSEGAVRRLVELRFPVALVALAEVLGDGPEAVLHDGPARLALHADRARTMPAECWVPGDLHVHRCSRPVRVELVLEPWSRTRTDVRLQARCKRGPLHLPRHYYDVAHDAIDALRDALSNGPSGMASRFSATAAVAC